MAGSTFSLIIALKCTDSLESPHSQSANSQTHNFIFFALVSFVLLFFVINLAFPGLFVFSSDLPSIGAMILSVLFTIDSILFTFLRIPGRTWSFTREVHICILSYQFIVKTPFRDFHISSFTFNILSSIHEHLKWSLARTNAEKFSIYFKIYKKHSSRIIPLFTHRLLTDKPLILGDFGLLGNFKKSPPMRLRVTVHETARWFCLRLAWQFKICVMKVHICVWFMIAIMYYNLIKTCGESVNLIKQVVFIIKIYLIFTAHISIRYYAIKSMYFIL